MLAGEPPHTGPTTQAIIAKLMTERPVRLRTVRDTVPESIERAVMKALAKVRADRFETAAQFAAALTTSGPVETGARAFAESGSQPPPNSIAVLPFMNLSADLENEYLSDGMSEELIHGLARVGGLHVVARTSAFAFKGKAEDVRTIGQRLNVGVVLEGSVRKAGNRIRVTAQLVNVADGYELWSEHYDRQLEDVFAIQDDISSAIIEVLKIRLLGQPGPAAAAPRTGDPTAYEFYLKGRYQWNKRTESRVKKGIDCFERAIEHDEHYAPAYAGLADSYAILGIYGTMAPNVAMTKAKAAALKALELDGTLAEAYTSLACVRAVYEWDWEGAERDFQHAIKNGPSYPTSRHWYAINLLAPVGRFDEALEQIKHAQKLDPLSLVINTTVGLQYYFARQYDSAIEEFLETLEIDSKFGMAHFFLGQAYEQQSRYQEAISAFQEAICLSDRSAETVAGLAHAYAISGSRAKAEALLLDLLEQQERSYVSPTLIAQIHVGLGDHESALEWLERAYELRAADLLWLNVRPVFDDIRGNARFGALVAKLGHERGSDDLTEDT
jgi:serine/threonine-protein kinase